MKKFTKLLGIVLIIALVMSMGVIAAVADITAIPTPEGGFTITMKTHTGHTYTAYQVFAGDLAEAEPEIPDDPVPLMLSNITWGDGVNSAALLAALKADTTFGSLFTSCTTAADVAEVLGDHPSTYYTDPIAKIIAANKAGNGTASTATSDSITISGLDAGYYLIVDTTAEESMPDGQTYSRFMLEVVQSIEIYAKDTSTTSEKKVKESDDSEYITYVDRPEWGDASDYDIGDAVTFRLYGYVAPDYPVYNTYYFAFHDEMSPGLTFNPDSVKVYLSGERINADGDFYDYTTEITDAFTVVEDPSDDCTFEVVCEDLKTLKYGGDPLVWPYDEIYVEFTATLNENAKIGEEGNPNTSYVEFSNNPNGNQHGKTKEDTVKVYTYKLVVYKMEDGGTDYLGNTTFKPLSGAEFALFKEYTAEKAAAAGKTEATKPESISARDWARKKAGSIWVEVEVVKSADGSVFTFNGIDNARYLLVETKTPTGYNSIPPQWFVLFTQPFEDHTQHAPDYKLLPQPYGPDSILEFKTSWATGTLETTILNNSGTILPSTGGIGTTIFYVVGSILVVAAGVLLITKKRMSNER